MRQLANEAIYKLFNATGSSLDLGWRSLTDDEKHAVGKEYPDVWRAMQDYLYSLQVVDILISHTYEHPNRGLTR